MPRGSSSRGGEGGASTKISSSGLFTKPAPKAAPHSPPTVHVHTYPPPIKKQSKGGGMIQVLEQLWLKV